MHFQTHFSFTALKEFQQSDIVELKEACNGVLWEVYGGDKGMYCDNPSVVQKERPQSAGTGPHIMISYQWDVQPRMLILREKLQKAGYRTWMDVDEMGKEITTCSVTWINTPRIMLVSIKGA